MSGDSRAKDEFRTAQGGIVYATGAEGTITGYGAGKMRADFGGAIIIDDPHKAGEANSPTMRQNVLDWFATTMESRKNSRDTAIIVIMQRLHESDLSGWLLDGGNGEDWEHLNIPALTEDEKSFWPEQFGLDTLHRIRDTNGYVFAGQYLQRPAPIGGGIFKDEWWQYYKVLPKIKYRAIYADTAQKTKEQNDYSVFQCWGMGEDGRIYLIDMVRGKWEAPELLVIAKAFWDKHKAEPRIMGTLRQFKVEDKASGTGLIQQLKQKKVPVVGIPRSIDKASRAMDAAPHVQAGNVVLPEESEWLSDILNEATSFPNASHDDTLDPLMDAVSDMLIEKQRPSYADLL
jgi:predicted phage terminase large subunit-like protein